MLYRKPRNVAGFYTTLTLTLMLYRNINVNVARNNKIGSSAEHLTNLIKQFNA